MQDIPISLKAKNDSGLQTLWLTNHVGECWFILTGIHRGKDIQIDFDTMERSELEDLKAAMELTLEAMPK